MNKCLFLIFPFLISCSANTSKGIMVVEKNSPIVQGKSLLENVGIETLGGVFTPLLDEGCKLPCELSQVFSTAEDNQNQITVTLVRGSSKLVKNGMILGKYKIIGIAPASRGEPEIKVTFGASEGNIWLIASDSSGKSKIQISKIE